MVGSSRDVYGEIYLDPPEYQDDEDEEPEDDAWMPIPRRPALGQSEGKT